MGKRLYQSCELSRDRAHIQFNNCGLSEIVHIFTSTQLMKRITPGRSAICEFRIDIYLMAAENSQPRPKF